MKSEPSPTDEEIYAVVERIFHGYDRATVNMIYKSHIELAEGFRLIIEGMKPPVPAHPYWCDECGAKSPFKMRGCEIDHEEGCSRFGEDGYAVWLAAYEYVKTTGWSIP